jgi:hypothetical protein
MKSIEECLDLILKDLAINWDNPENKRAYLKGWELLKKFELPENMQKHEFFKRLIHKLIEDNYAEEDVAYPLKKGDALSHYEKSALITIEGYYFITKEGGYTQRKINHDAESNRVEKLETSQQKLMGKLNVLTGWIAGGTIALVLVELWNLALDHHWFSCLST